MGLCTPRPPFPKPHRTRGGQALPWGHAATVQLRQEARLPNSWSSARPPSEPG